MTHRDGLPRFYGRFGASVNVDISRSTGAKSSVRTGTSAGATRASWCSTVNPGAGAGISSPGCPLPWPLFRRRGLVYRNTGHDQCNAEDVFD